MRMALISGDGLPVSGLLTVFRNVVNLGMDEGLLHPLVPADLGYSWRPDKPAFYPRGAGLSGYPDWLTVTDTVPMADTDALSTELIEIRHQVARAETLNTGEMDALERRIESLAEPYERYFVDWFGRYDVDWVCAINMTLSDAVPVTVGLHRAADRRWGAGRPGGVLFWDHDLYGTYAVHMGTERVYPRAPNAFTPVPGAPCHRWAVVSEGLAKEAATYPTTLIPELVPNVLPTVPIGLDDRHRRFLEQRGIDARRPVIVCPVRVFRVKGLEISIRLFAAVRSACLRRGDPVPYLLVFGSLREDPEYTAAVFTAIEGWNIGEDVHFLDGVPLGSHQDVTGNWRLDEIDLLRICAATGGGIFFTPNRPDVESVGLGPALAAVAGVPCAATGYGARDEVYGAEYALVRVDSAVPERAAAEFTEWLNANRRADPAIRGALAANRDTVRQRFPAHPWRALLRDLARSVRGVSA